MRTPLVQKVYSVSEMSERNRWVLFESCRRVGSKITGFALERLGNGRMARRAALLQTITSPRVVIDLLSSLAVAVRQEEETANDPVFNSVFKKKINNQRIPIGLHKCPASCWVNAWAQFLIHLPKFCELVSYLSKSFEPFREFIDQYLVDQKTGCAVSVADSGSLIRCLVHSPPFILSISNEAVDFHEISTLFFKSIFFPISSTDLGSSFNESIVFHPDWILVSEGEDKQLFEKEMQKKMEMSPCEILLGFKRGGSSTHSFIKRQMFHSAGRYFYELDSFIEYRPDANGVSFITYVLVDGAWVQCDDEKIRLISSRTVSIPLCRGVLFHYKRVGI